MRVTLFRDFMEDNWISMEVYADQLWRALVQAFPEMPFHAVRPRSPFHRFPVAGWSQPVQRICHEYIGRHVYYRWVARRCRSDVYHVLDHSYGHLVHSLDPGRTVVTCHDLIPLKMRETRSRPGERLALRAFMCSLKGMCHACRIITDSQATQRDVVEYLGCAPGRVTVVYAGIDPVYGPLQNRDRLEMFRQSRLPGGSEGKYILHVGGCTYYKNVEAVIETLSLLVNRWKFKVLLAKVGEEFTQEQKRLIHRHGLEGMVVHLGRVSREELCWLYNAADLLLFPSHYEGFGFPVVEAMACGLPVVTSNVSSLPEVVGDAAITVAPTDYEGMAQAVCAVLTNEELRRTLSGKGLERAQQFSWEKAAKATFRIYQEIHELSCPA